MLRGFKLMDINGSQRLFSRSERVISDYNPAFGKWLGPGPLQTYLCAADVVVHYRKMLIGHLGNREKRCEVQYVDDKP